jgi:hypothetical protein
MAAESETLLDFISAAKNQGASDEFIVALLRQNGWSERRIYQAFGVWYEAHLGKEVPSGGGRIEAAKDAFLYLLAFMTLGIWAIQLGALLFTAIDRAFPNPTLDYSNPQFVMRSMANELASIIVGFPLFLSVTWLIVRGIERQPERLESAVRKWLTYIALVLTAGAIIGDLVTFLTYLLRGDLDIRFILKTITVAVISGGIFAYYLDSLRREQAGSARNRVFAMTAAAAVSFAIVIGFVQIGSPAAQRLQSQDGRRLFDLSSLAQAIHLGWQARGRTVLPASVTDVRMNNAARTVDPVTGEAYRYAPLQGTTYQLCATFARPSPSGVAAAWRHAAGPVCFTLDAREYAVIVPQPW